MCDDHNLSQWLSDNSWPQKRQIYKPGHSISSNSSSAVASRTELRRVDEGGAVLSVPRESRREDPVTWMSPVGVATTPQAGDVGQSSFAGAMIWSPTSCKRRLNSAVRSCSCSKELPYIARGQRVGIR